MTGGRAAISPVLIAAAAGALPLPAAHAQQQGGQPVTATIEGHVLRPGKLEPTDERVATLQLPAGFRITKFAEGLGNPRMLAVAPDGSVFVTRRLEGDVLRLHDLDGDGKAEEREVAVPDLPDVHGITFHQGRCYLATIKEVLVCEVQPDGSLGTPRPIITDLPDGGQHPNRTLAFGPDGGLYITVGSTCNDCEEPNPEHATILRADPDGSRRAVFATGLRNTIGFGWHPQTGEMWGMDHGIDWLGDDVNAEELNRIEEGRFYGWPFIFEDGKRNPVREPSRGTIQDYAARNVAPVLTYTPHAAPLQMAFYTAEGPTAFPEDYRGDAFVAMRGSWNRMPPSGYEVVRIRFRDGQPEAFEPFLTGFLSEDGKAHFGRPVGVAVARDGALLVGDDTCGVIYRISHGEAGP